MRKQILCLAAIVALLSVCTVSRSRTITAMPLEDGAAMAISGGSGVCYAEGQQDCPMTYKECGDTLCTSRFIGEGDDVELIWECRGTVLGVYGDQDKVPGGTISGCVLDISKGTKEDIEDDGQVFCWKEKLCLLECQQKSDLKYYCKQAEGEAVNDPTSKVFKKKCKDIDNTCNPAGS